MAITLDNFASGSSGNSNPVSQIQFTLLIASTTSVIIAGGTDVVAAGNPGSLDISSILFGPYTMFPTPGGNGNIFYLPNIRQLSGAYTCTINVSSGGETQIIGFAASYIGSDNQVPFRVPTTAVSNPSYLGGAKNTTYSLSPYSESGDLILHAIVLAAPAIGSPSMTYATNEVQDGSQKDTASFPSTEIFLAHQAGGGAISFLTTAPNTFNYWHEALTLQPPVNKGLFFGI